MVLGWALKYPNLLVLGDFNVDNAAAASTQPPYLVSFMEVVGLSQFLLAPMHQVGHTTDLIFAAGLI